MKRLENKKTRSLLNAILVLAFAGVLVFSLCACQKDDGASDGTEADSGVASDIGTESNTESADEGSSESESAEDTTFEQEILGQGTEEDPYLLTPVNMKAETLEIPASGSSFYGIYRVGGKIFTINDANAYVICEGVTYNAENGKVTFTVPDALASDAVLFEIGNKSGTASSFVLEFSAVPGSLDAAFEVDSLDSDITVSIPEGTSQGYYYKYFAEKDGTIRFYMTSSVDAGMTVDRIRNGSEIIQLVMDEETVDGSGNRYIEVEVKKGDELRINLSAIPNKRGKYPAVDVTWRGKYN